MSAIVEKLANLIMDKTKCQLKDKVTIGYEAEFHKQKEKTLNMRDKKSIDILFKEAYFIESITFTMNEWDKRKKNLKLKYMPIDMKEGKWLLKEVGKGYKMFDVSGIGGITKLDI